MSELFGPPKSPVLATKRGVSQPSLLAVLWCMSGLAVLCANADARSVLVSPSWATQAALEVISGEAYAIDGDTIKLDRKTKVRLLGVAAPEKRETGGMEATQFMTELVNGKNLLCELTGARSYDRVVGTCFLDGQDIGAAVIAAGLARDCPRYSGGRYKSIERSDAKLLPFPKYCR